MSMRKKLRWLLLVPVALAAAATFMPWQVWVEQKLIATIAAKGYGPVALTLDRVGLSGITLRDVVLGEPALKLANVTVGYSPRALLKGELKNIRVNGLHVNITQSENGWTVEGLPTMPTTTAPEENVALPVTLDALKKFPFTQLELLDSAIHVAAKTFEAQLTLDAMVQHGISNSLQLHGRKAEITLPANRVTLGAIKTELTLDHAAQQWNGNWSLGSIVIDTQAQAIPPLNATGTLTIQADAVQFTGSMTSDDARYEAKFAGEYALTKPERSYVKLLHAEVPWSGGVISVNNAKIPLAPNTAIAVTLEVKKVAIDTLMQALTGSKATASGVVSGQLPLRISKSGAISVGKTSLKADGPGIIALSPEAIPGDNAQVAMVRDLLKNLHYTVLALELDMAPDNTLSATLAVEGANPDSQNGRAVKLNVHLSGDLLNFIVQNTQLMTDPKSFIEQKNHE